jgi:glycosyltransferase involved in cell wall biosynthesis
MLLGQNHLASHGIDARVHDAWLTRARTTRVRWHTREVMLPWELRDADAVVTPLATLLPIAARLRGRPRVVVVNYGLTTRFARSSPARRRLLRRSAHAAAAHVALARSQGETWAEQTGIPPERWRAIPLGVDVAWWSSRGRPNGERLILAVGKDEARDYATLAEAIAGLDVRAILATNPHNLNGVRLPPNAVARFVGPAELRELYARAACVVVPQRRPEYPLGSEAGGITTVLEAAAMERPLVVTDRPVIREYVEPDSTAVVVPAEDPAALRSGITRVLEDAALARRLGAAARARVEREHTMERFAERLADFLRPILDARPGRL